jgi:hypothetical protein
VEALLARFAADADKPVVAEAMTDLLLNSYYPSEKDMLGSTVAIQVTQLRRCLAFLGQNEATALAFYSHLFKVTSVGSAVKMCSLLLDLLDEALQNDGFVSILESSSGASPDGVENETNKDTEDRKHRGETSQKLLGRAKRRRDAEVSGDTFALRQSMMALVHRLRRAHRAQPEADSVILRSGA